MRTGLGPQVAFHLSRAAVNLSSMPAGTKEIQIVVNGQVRPAPEGQSLTELLGWLNVDPARVAVELNRTIVSRSDWDRTMVASGATLEIVQFVGGG
jgi:sulfur carrier protein